LIPKNS